MLRNRWCGLRMFLVAVIFTAHVTTLAALLTDAHQTASEARQEERVAALTQRVEKAEEAGDRRQNSLDELTRDMSAVKSEIAGIKAEMATSRWMLGVMLTGISLLIGSEWWKLFVFRKGRQ